MLSTSYTIHFLCGLGRFPRYTCHISGFGPRPNGDGELPKFFVPLLSIFWKFHQAKRLNARSPGDCDIAPGECSRLGRLLCYGAGRSFRDGHREP